jgi:hypothetical protein
MKYTSKIKSRQFILDEKGKKIYIEPGSGAMSDEEAYAVAKSPWGKNLIAKGFLTFEKTIEVKEDKIQRGMSIPKGKGKRKNEKGSSENAGDNEENPESDEEPSGDDSEGNGDDDGVSINIETETSEEIPDFDKNAGDSEEN